MFEKQKPRERAKVDDSPVTYRGNVGAVKENEKI